jgi:DNA modification methylase
MRPKVANLKQKDLVGIPWRVAFALQSDGWWLRQDIIWAKPNPMPESVRDRCTKAHEYLFLLAKSERYFYDAEAVSEALSGKPHAPGNKCSADGGHLRNDFGTDAMQRVWGASGRRNRRSVWTVTTKPYSGAHFATFPPKLIEPCILAGCPERCCAECGAGWERVVERTAATPQQRTGYTMHCGGRNDGERPGHFVDHTCRTIGHRPTCECNAATIPGTVLDPFAGSGTTLAVAIEHGRNSIGIELNPAYIDLANKRIAESRDKLGMFAGVN